MGKTCFFIGHRDAEDSLLPQLNALVEQHITEYGVEEFVVGRYGRFDSLAAKAVMTAKKTASRCAAGLSAPISPCGAK